MPKLTFLPAGLVIEVPAGTTVFEAARAADVIIPSQCGGMCACALCKVRVIEGERGISPMRDNERSHLGNVFFITKERLSCQLQVLDDLVVEVPEPREKVKKRYIPLSVLRKREAAAAGTAPEAPRPRGPQAEAEIDARRARPAATPGRTGRGSFADRFRLDSEDEAFTGDRLLGSHDSDQDYRALFRGLQDDDGHARAPSPDGLDGGRGPQTPREGRAAQVEASGGRGRGRDPVGRGRHRDGRGPGPARAEGGRQDGHRPEARDGRSPVPNDGDGSRRGGRPERPRGGGEVPDRRPSAGATRPAEPWHRAGPGGPEGNAARPDRGGGHDRSRPRSGDDPRPRPEGEGRPPAGEGRSTSRDGDRPRSDGGRRSARGDGGRPPPEGPGQSPPPGEERWVDGMAAPQTGADGGSRARAGGRRRRGGGVRRGPPEGDRAGQEPRPSHEPPAADRRPRRPDADAPHREGGGGESS